MDVHDPLGSLIRARRSSSNPGCTFDPDTLDRLAQNPSQAELATHSSPGRRALSQHRRAHRGLVPDDRDGPENLSAKAPQQVCARSSVSSGRAALSRNVLPQFFHCFSARFRRNL